MRFDRFGCRTAVAGFVWLLAACLPAWAADAPDAASAERLRKLEAARAAVVGVHAHSVADARSNDSLGRERKGSGWPARCCSTST